MTGSLAFALAGAALVGIGLYGFIAQRALLRRILAFNVIGSGVFLIFGALGRRGEGSDPAPQAMIITGIVVALSATALAVALIRRLEDSAAGSSEPEGDDG